MIYIKECPRRYSKQRIFSSSADGDRRISSLGPNMPPPPPPPNAGSNPRYQIHSYHIYIDKICRAVGNVFRRAAYCRFRQPSSPGRSILGMPIQQAPLAYRMPSNISASNGEDPRPRQPMDGTLCPAYPVFSSKLTQKLLSR